jgi:hypothetical protein
MQSGGVTLFTHQSASISAGAICEIPLRLSVESTFCRHRIRPR